jgi:hypothetical protein
MTQIALPFRRFDIPFARWSWREGDRTVVVEIGAHSLDESWPWWRPWAPTNFRSAQP